MADINDPDRAPKIVLYFKQWREWRGWTQRQLAERIGVSIATVSRHESEGKRVNISKSYLEKFVHAVGCPNPWDPIAGPPGSLPPTYQLLRNLKPDSQEQAHRIIETFRDRDP